ncbi:galactose oxidase early set domain-containing protein [Actinocorallia sp. B10E7]|uniref:galactose oxidase early set domain-containing protein n=1 Tax=Actinocorallia sp. B10E7 TaxID=3153558 RepID=UPI00325F260B
MRFRRSRASAVLSASLLGTTVLPGLSAPALSAPAGGLRNPGFERLAGGFPACWTRLSTGRNSGTVRVVRKARRGGRAMEVRITRHVRGFRAVVQKQDCALKVQPGRRYDLGLSYRSTSGRAAVVLFRQKADGRWARWHAFPHLPSSRKYRRASFRTPVVPKDTGAIRFAVGLQGRGTLVTDDHGFRRAEGRAGCAGPECSRGHWVVRDFGDGGVRAIHSVLLHNGKVLLIAGSGNSVKRFKRGRFVTKVYDPETNGFTTVPTPYDMFCAGHVQLPDGRVLVVSGTAAYANNEDGRLTSGWVGSKKSYVFDPRTERYTRVDDLNDGHWYPSATILGNGDVYSVGGYASTLAGDGSNKVSTVAERFSWREGRWLDRDEVAQPGINWATYPSLILAGNGRLFYSGSSVFGHPVNKDGSLRGPGFLDPNTGGWRALRGGGGLRSPKARDMSASVLLPPAQDQRVMVVGGKNFSATGKYAIRRTDVIDLKKGMGARYKAGPDLPRGRVNMGGVESGRQRFAPQPARAGKTYVSAVILPDGTVLETGGSQRVRLEHVHEASILDPKGRRPSRMRWKRVAADPVSRTYHNTALLLPDGRVLAVGSNPGNAGPDGDSYFDTRISLYSPPYLYKEGGARPRITSVPKGWSYGSRPVVTTDTEITGASLVRPAAVTHSSDPNQRLVRLPVSRLGGGRYRLQMDRRPAMAPPGWYMLFVTGRGGVPSRAQWVHVS